MSSARYRDRYSTSGAKSDAGDAHVLAEIVRLDRAHHREIAGDTDLADAVKLLGRAHQNLIWERVRHVLRLRSALLEFFPVAVQAFPDLAAIDALILLGRAPDPARAGKLTRSQVVSALTAARRHHIADKAEPLQTLLRQPGLRQPAAVEAAYAAIVAGQVKLLIAINEQVTAMQAVMSTNFDLHPAAQIYLSQPGLGPVLAARVLGEFGDDPKRFASARARKNYSGQSRSPERPEKRRSCWPGMPPTADSAWHCTCRPSAHSTDHPTPAPTTTPSAPAEPATTPPCAKSPTESSASSTAASTAAPSTTKPSPGTPPQHP